MDIVLDIVFKLWITTGPLVLMGFLFISGVAQGKWNHFIWAVVVFLTGAVFLQGGGSSVIGIFIEKIAVVYDVNKSTAEFLKIIDSKPPGLGHVIILTLYTYVKYLVKILFCHFIMSVFGTNPKFWGMLFLWHVLMIMVCISGMLGSDLHSLVKSLIKYEGCISVAIVAVFIAYKAIFGVGGKSGGPDGKEEGRSILTVAVFVVGSVVAFSYALAFEARLWKHLDGKVFGIILGA